MNPINSTAKDGQQVGTAPSNPINDPGFSSRQGSSTYDLSAQNLLTARFGEITPFFYFNAIGRDRLELRSSQDLRTYTLGAPLMSSVRMKKSYFSVPFKCIMPSTWDYLFVNPVKGNDVPDDANCLVDLVRLAKGIVQTVSSFDYVQDEDNSSFVRLFCLFYFIFSKGSLLDYLGVSTHQLLNGIEFGSFDSLDLYLDHVLSDMAELSDWSIRLEYNDSDFTTGESQDFVYHLSSGASAQEIRAFIYRFTRHPDALLFCSGLETVYNDLTHAIRSFDSLFPASNKNQHFYINLYKLVAYQLVCAQYYTNDHVDSIYNANLWMSNMKSLAYDVIGSNNYTFKLNGVDIYYDIFSKHILDILSVSLSEESCQFFWFNLLTYRRSLRYGDYFNSSRPEPLAVGDVSVPLTGDGVNVIDINKNLHVQRFLNAVNRLGSNIVDYARGIFGYRPQAVDPTPNFISSEYVSIGSDEIDNTAESQGTVNTNLVSQSSQFAFDVSFTDNSVVLGLVTFEVLGAYPYTVERDNFHKDRYDMFNPFLQHIGDQEVYSSELGSNISQQVPFGYQVRYAEYKFKYPQQHGGFNDQSLKLWSMPYDVSTYLTEDFIRFNPTDFDKFYKSLSYFSLANYFHFQISFLNSLRANRPMDFAPGLLG